MKEEFTTAMHYDLLGCEETEEDIYIMGVFGAMKRYKSLKKALCDYTEVTEQQFKENVVRVIGFETWDVFKERYGHLLDT